MAWIFLAASGGSPSLSVNGFIRSPTVKLIDTLKLCCCREWLMGEYHEVQSGMTLHRLEGPCYQVSTSFTADFPARTSALQDLEQAWRESAQAFTMSSGDSLAIYDPDSCSWKTSQLSLIEDLSRLVWTSLRWGMIRDGRFYQPANLEPRTSERDGGYWPTPTARDYKSPGLSRTRKASIEDRRGIPLSVYFKEEFGINLHPSFVEWMMGYAQKHTVLEPWAMQWFRPKRGRRSCA
jgi:hypothetical protein